MRIHLVIVQPDNYVHSLGFLDTADYLQHWLQRQGLEVSLGKNRLRHDSVNIVFGAHLGAHPDWLSGQFAVLFFNLEQIGEDGARITPAYENLLRTGPVMDYHPLNVAAYGRQAGGVPLIPFWNAPYLNPPSPELNLSQRPIDLLFFGSVNEERKAFLRRVEKAGWDVAVFDAPTYYEERDAYVRQAKAVLNTSFYASARFEQVRAFNVLSQGTAFITYLQPGQKVAQEFQEHVFWVDESNFEKFFRQEFGSTQWCVQAQQKYRNWLHTDPTAAFAQLTRHMHELWSRHTAQESPVAKPRQILQAEDGSYYQDVLNVSASPLDEADLNMDLTVPGQWPWQGVSRWGQPLQLALGQIERLVIRSVPRHQAGWHALLSNAMDLLRTEGHLVLEFSLISQKGQPARSHHWHEGQAVLPLYAEQFWRSGNFLQRLTVIQTQWLNTQGQPCEADAAQTCRVVLEKRETTTRERTLARVQSPGFGKSLLAH